MWAVDAVARYLWEQGEWVLERSRDTSPATPATPATRLQDGIPERGGWKGQPPQTPAQPPRVLNGSRTAFAGDAGDAGDDSPLLSNPGDGGTWEGEEGGEWL